MPSNLMTLTLDMSQCFSELCDPLFSGTVVTRANFRFFSVSFCDQVFVEIKKRTMMRKVKQADLA